MWMPMETTVIPIITVRGTYPGINAVAKHLLKLCGTVHDETDYDKTTKLHQLCHYTNIAAA